MNNEHNPGLVIGLEKPPTENKQAESQRAQETQPKLDKKFRQRLGNLFLRAVFGKNGLLVIARQEHQASVSPSVDINPVVPIKAETVKWRAAEGVPGLIEPAPQMGDALRPQAEVRAKVAMPQETQPDYTQSQEIKARVGVDIPQSTTAVYSGRLVGEEPHEAPPKSV